MKSKGVFLARLIPLLFLLAFTSEDEFHKRLQEKLNGYYQRNLPVTLSFFFNQTQYVPGDTVFFRALFVKAADHQRVPGRQIVNVDLTNPKGVTVLQQKIVLENGWAANQIVIPRDLPPGAYTLVGFSNWMKNQDHRLFSYNRILISGLTQITIDNNQPLRFFPEGGALISGVNNKIVSTGTPGEKVTITDSQDRSVASVVLDRFGLGIFDITPTERESYKGIAENKKVDLPSVSNIPVRMMIAPSISGSPLTIGLETTRATDQTFYLSIVHHQKVYHEERISFEGERNAAITIPYDELMPGMSLVTLFSEDGTALLNRIIFTRDASAASVKIDADHRTHAPREKITVSLQLMNDQGEPVAGNVSVAVQDSALLPPDDQHAAQELAFGDLPYSALTHPAIQEMDDNALNNFLITQEWCRFKWDDVMDDKTFDRHPAFSYVRLAGKAVHPEGKSFGDSTQITFFLQKDAIAYQAYVDSVGNFNFPLAIDFESTDVYYRVESKRHRQKGILIQSAVNHNHSFLLPGTKESTTPSALGLFSAKKSLVDNAYLPALDVKNYARRSKEMFDNSLSEYFVADIEVTLADYMLFPTMEETFREIVTSVAHRMVDRRSTIRIHLPDKKLWGTENPLFIVDGVITDDIDYLMSLKPQHVRVIKVINSRKNTSVLGPIGENGVLIIETNIPDNARNVPRPDATFYAVGISQSVPFLNLTPKDFHPRVPVIKSCLYWNPDVTTDANGKATFSFYAADNTGTFRILVDGVTEQGDPVSGMQHIVIKLSSTQ